jgi:hypothetical protein
MAPLNQALQTRIEWLFDMAQRHTQDFASLEASLARQRYNVQHPTAIMVMKCMDGRINIPIATQTPRGIIQPFRNLGGIFHLGWPHLGEVLMGAVNKAIHQGRQALMIITYHFAKGHERRGCAGFYYRTADGKALTYTQPDPPAAPLDPAGALATLLAVTETVSVADAANAVGLTPADLIAEAEAWAAAQSS